MITIINKIVDTFVTGLCTIAYAITVYIAIGLAIKFFF